MATPATYSSADPRHYIWWFPGSPVRVHLDLSVIEGLQKRLKDTGPGTPDHGLLFGRVAEGATEILDYQPASGRSMPEMSAELAAEPRRRFLVGYYRTEHGEALRLNEDDLFLFKTFFGKPHHVFLMIQPNAFEAPNATFFFSRGNQTVSEFPFLEFPLDASLLATEERDRMSRLKQAAEPPVAVPHSVDAAPAEAPKRQRTLLKGAAAFVAGILLAGVWFSIPVLRQRSSRVWNAILTAIPQPHSVAPASSNPHPHIGLQVKRQDRDLELTWDRESPWVVSATSGLISIEDGPVKRQIALDTQQLHGESILYSPTSDPVRIELTITAPTGAATESIRIIRGEAIPTHSMAAFKPTVDAVKSPQAPVESAPLAQQLKPFTPPPMEKPAASPTVLTEAPVVSNSLTYPAVSFAIPQTLVPPQRPPADRKEAIAPATEASDTATYHPPVPISRVQPKFPAEFKSLTFKPTLVEIRVTVSMDGKVIKAEPLPQPNVHQLFIKEATYAARSWRFRPAMRGDQPVSSEVILRFNFSKFSGE